MGQLSSHEILRLFLALGVVLGMARLAGETARKLGQPAVLGEILAGILLGPTALGRLAPGAVEFLFPRVGGVSFAFDGLKTIAISLFLLVAGMEIDLSTMARQSKSATLIGALGLAIPFVTGWSAAFAWPELLGVDGTADHKVFALFFATALAVSALPVIAKTLMDLHLYRSDFGMVVMAAAMGDDLIGWLVFAVLLGQIGHTGASNFGVATTIVLTLVFALTMLSLGRRVLHAVLPWLQAHMSWPAGVLGFSLTFALLAGAFTEFIGIHAIFGAFLFGIALGDSSHLRERERTTIFEFVSSVFAPLFFGSIGLRVDFVANFDLALCAIVLVIACVGKVLGCGAGARWSGMSWRESVAIGFAMNSRGVMAIVLALIALEAGLVGEPMFVALVIMALVTSLLSGPIVQRMLGRTSLRRAADYFVGRSFVPRLAARRPREAITELCQALGPTAGESVDQLIARVWKREERASTGIGHGIAVPHARLAGLRQPLVVAGISREGVDFGAHDGAPVKLVFLILTPEQDDGAQLELLSSLGRSFDEREIRERALHASSATELLALLRTDRAAVHAPSASATVRN